MSENETDRFDVLLSRLGWARIAVVVLAISTTWLWYRQTHPEERRCAWTYDEVDLLLSFVYEEDHPRPPGLNDSQIMRRHDNERHSWTLDVLREHRVQLARRRQQLGTLKECR